MHSCCMLTACRSPPIISSTRRNGEEGSKTLTYPTAWAGEHYENLGCSFYGGNPCVLPSLKRSRKFLLEFWGQLCPCLLEVIDKDLSASLEQTTQIEKGAALFRTSCVGCHDGGGNILQPGATLFSNDLERNGVSTQESIYEITYYGKGRMPGFGEKCTPRGQCTFGARLQDDEIKLLAMFVKSQAEQGWPNIEIYKD